MPVYYNNVRLNVGILQPYIEGTCVSASINTIMISKQIEGIGLIHVTFRLPEACLIMSALIAPGLGFLPQNHV